MLWSIYEGTNNDLSEHKYNYTEDVQNYKVGVGLVLNPRARSVSYVRFWCDVRNQNNLQATSNNCNKPCVARLWSCGRYGVRICNVYM